MFSKLKRFLAYDSYVKSVGSFSKMGKEELLAARQKNAVLESMVDDECKHHLFRAFASGKASKEYVDGFLNALAFRKYLTHPDSSK